MRGHVKVVALDSADIDPKRYLETLRREAEEQPDNQSSSYVSTAKELQANQTSASLDIDSFAKALQSKFNPSTASPSITVDMDPVAKKLQSFIESTSTITRKSRVSPEQLAACWKCGVEAARRTLENTTQLAVRYTNNVSGSRRPKPRAFQLRCIRLTCVMCVDIIYGKCVSLDGYMMMVLFATDFHWSNTVPIKEKKDAHRALDQLFRKVGVPMLLVPDDEMVLGSGEFAKTASRARCDIHPIEACTKNSGRVEDNNREVKHSFRRSM